MKQFLYECKQDGVWYTISIYRLRKKAERERRRRERHIVLSALWILITVMIIAYLSTIEQEKR